MVAALLTDRLARDAARQDWQVDSAGVWAAAGHPATAYGIDEMRERGIDLYGHRSQPVTRELVGAADLVLAMTRNHVEALQVAFPDQAHKVYLLTQMVGREYDIADPYGGSRLAYSATARSLEALIEDGYERIVALAEAAPLGK
jgi:protein-tyrosine phosphatase